MSLTSWPLGQRFFSNAIGTLSIKKVRNMTMLFNVTVEL